MCQAQLNIPLNPDIVYMNEYNVNSLTSGFALLTVWLMWINQGAIKGEAWNSGHCVTKTERDITKFPHI